MENPTCSRLAKITLQFIKSSILKEFHLFKQVHLKDGK